MTELLHFLGTFSLGAVVAGVIGFLLMKSFVPSYLKQKAENLATREDIGKITHEIEGVRAEYAAMLEALKGRQQLRIAALDRRLQAHQEAYQLWREINGALGRPELQEVAGKCSKWWGDNCLYLEPEARAAFLAAFVGARDLDWYRSNQDAADLVSKVQREINDAGGVIEKCVALPNLREMEVAQKRG